MSYNYNPSGYVRKIGKRWYAVVNYPDPDRPGKRKQRSAGSAATRKEAQALLDQVMAEHRKKAYRKPTEMSVANYLDMWLDAQKLQLKPKTIESYGHMVTRLSKELGHNELSQLNAMKISQALLNMKERGAKERTLEYCYVVFKKALSDAKKQNLLPVNPMEGVAKPQNHRPPRIPLTVDQVKTFLTSIPQGQFKSLITVLIYTGLRRGEILGLRWSDLDLEHGMVNIQQAMVDIHGQMTASTPKSRTASRSVALPPTVVKLLVEQKVVQDGHKAKLGDNYCDHNLVFASKLGTPLSPSRLRKQINSALSTAGLPHITIHDLRHTHATLLLLAGVHPKIVSERLGHRDINITLNTYSHVLPGMQKRAAQAVEKILAPSGDS